MYLYIIVKGIDLDSIVATATFIDSINSVAQTLALAFAFQYFFTMKRVEIQMNEDNTTVPKTLLALRK